MSFLVKSHRSFRSKRTPIVVAEEVSVHNPEVLRPTGRRIGGLFREVEGTGRRNRKHFNLAVVRGKAARGEKLSERRVQAFCEATGAGVKKTIRRLRPQEAEQIAAVDAEISQLFALLDEAQDRREGLVKEAFTRGHVVRLAEMREMVETWEQDVEARKAG